MVAIIIIFPDIVSYGDEAQKAQAQMERDGTAPPAVDLDSLMKQDEASSDAEDKEREDNTAANLLKNLQSDK
jgi:chromosome condensin MukBEF MukE localization factor